MGLFGAPRPIPKPTPKPEPKPGLWGQRSSYEGGDLKQYLRKATRNIPGTSRTYTEPQRVGLERVFKKYGAGSSGTYTPENIKNALNRMKKEWVNMPHDTEVGSKKRKELEGVIKYWEQLEKGK